MKEAVQFLIEQGYIVLFLWVLFEQLGFPIPVVPILLAAGALAGIGKLSFVLVFCLAFLAALLLKKRGIHQVRPLAGDPSVGVKKALV